MSEAGARSSSHGRFSFCVVCMCVRVDCGIDFIERKTEREREKESKYDSIRKVEETIAV